MIKIGDMVYYKEFDYAVVCMDKANYGLAHIDNKGNIVGGLPVYMVPKTTKLEPIATRMFDIGDKVMSLLRENGGQTMTGTVVGYELGNRLIVKSDKGNDRVRYSYSPLELNKYNAATISMPISKLIEMHNGQLKFSFNTDDKEFKDIMQELKKYR